MKTVEEFDMTLRVAFFVPILMAILAMWHVNNETDGQVMRDLDNVKAKIFGTHPSK